MAWAVLTWLRASCLDRPAASARTWVPPSPWRSRPAKLAAAAVCAARMRAAAALDSLSISRISAPEADPSLTTASNSLAAAWTRRAASTDMKTVSHTGVISVKHLQVFLSILKLPELGGSELQASPTAGPPGPKPHPPAHAPSSPPSPMTAASPNSRCPSTWHRWASPYRRSSWPGSRAAPTCRWACTCPITQPLSHTESPGFLGVVGPIRGGSVRCHTPSVTLICDGGRGVHRLRRET